MVAMLDTSQQREIAAALIALQQKVKAAVRNPILLESLMRDLEQLIKKARQ